MSREKELLTNLPSEVPLTGDNLRVVYSLLMEEGAFQHNDEVSFKKHDEILSKWRKSSCYSKKHKFMGALLDL